MFRMKMNIIPPSVSDLPAMGPDSSPFEIYATNNTTFAIYLEPILDTQYKTYQHIITMNAVPPGPLANMVGLINAPRLSEFQAVPRNGNTCIYALLRYPKGNSNKFRNPYDKYMGKSDIPSIYGYLKANGYHIDTHLTKLSISTVGGIDESNYGGNRQLICIVDSRNLPERRP